MSEALPETEHFRIIHAHWNIGTNWPTYSIQPKDNTKNSKAMLPQLAKARCMEALIPHLHEAERWYVANKKSLEAHAAKDEPMWYDRLDTSPFGLCQAASQTPALMVNMMEAIGAAQHMQQEIEQ